ncbi:hypothetical protein AB0J52_06405 [Spirillospora sp. NPDC049652]
MGLAAGVVGALASGLTFGLLVGLAVAFGGGLASGLTLSDHRAWPAYLIATWQLARTGLLPRRLMPFLDDCHRIGLLRAVGPVYQFRHADLHDYLATAYIALKDQ